MSFADEDFEELDLDSEVLAITSSQFSTNTHKPKNKKKLKIPILDKTTADPNTFEYETLLKQLNLTQMAKIDSNFVKTPSPRSNARQTVERLLFNHQLSENRKQFLRKEKEMNEIKSCTFSPTIQKQQKTIKKNSLIKDKSFESAVKTSVKEAESKGKAAAKSHSQEHHIENTGSFRLKIEKIALEGRPPIPKHKVNK